MGFDRMPKAHVLADRVAISSSDAGAFHDAPFLELGYDPLHRPFRYANPRGDFPQHAVWILAKAEQHVRVIGEEGPAAGFFFRGRVWHSVRPSFNWYPVKYKT